MDPVLFEVIRHRLSTIMEEGAIALRETSGSPTVAMMGDCNVALLDAAGQCVLVGRTVPDHATSCIATVRYVRAEYADNPGFGPGDLFLSNDPYISTPHQNCIVVVGPIYAADALLGWAGAASPWGAWAGPSPGHGAGEARPTGGSPGAMPRIGWASGAWSARTSGRTSWRARARR